ncbi:hypothetical protein PybrP1_010540 [[Pythium] brassicae (nom. inval.)]|nr:hypothetical protein PybrP1_010540 [[Pythium] brassicae (nom. inval.)]
MAQKHLLALSGVYVAVGVTFALLARSSSFPRDGASAFLAVLWLGFVLAISFMEAWVKFRAPFVARHLVLDVGRTVFAALNVVELSLCAGLWLVRLVGDAHFSPLDGSILLVVLTVVLGAQFALLYPRLEMRAQFALYDELQTLPDESLTFHQKTLFAKIRRTVKKKVRPSPAFHVAYVLGEVTKVVLLAVFSLRILNHMPQMQ